MMTTTMPTSVVDALIAAGGCVHTPEPQKGCDTCGRGPAVWAINSQVLATDWLAGFLGAGSKDVQKKDVLSLANIPTDDLARLTVATDSPRVPFVRVGVDPSKGERLHMFTRHSSQVSARTGGSGTKLSVLVLEVTFADGKFVRLYLHPLMGPILSTEDLYF